MKKSEVPSNLLDLVGEADVSVMQMSVKLHMVRFV